MLQFFKKSGRGTNSCNDKTPLDNKNKRHSMPSSLNFQSVDIILDENLIENEQDKLIESRSRLSMNLTEIVSNKNCLSYLIQFLETKNALSLIKFYLDAECFKTATEKLFKQIANNNIINNKIRTTSRKVSQSTSSECSADKISINSNNFDISSDLISIDSQLNETSSSTTTLHQSSNDFVFTNNYKDNCLDETVYEKFPKSNQLNEYEINNSNNKSSNSDNNKIVPELKTLCDLSMRKPLTDDEKSLICAETIKRKQSLIKYSNSAAINNKIIDEYNLIKSNYQSSTSINSIIATDAIKIYRKYLNRNSQYYIDIPAEIHSTISLELCSQQQEHQETNVDNVYDDGSINENYYCTYISALCFSDAQKYIFDRLEHEYLNEFLESSFYCKYILDILTNVKKLKLTDILNSESALFYFMEYLEQENQRNLLEFWMAAINYRKHYQQNQYNNNNIKILLNDAKNDAMILYEKYFSLQAETPLNISNKIRSCIEENICSFNDINNDDNIKFIGNCFDLPICIIEKYIDKEYFQNFLLSQLFANYLNEMKSKIPQQQQQNTNKKTIIDNKNLIANAKCIKNHRKSLSDCTFDTNNFVSQKNGFISQQNTLLAMESISSNNTKFKTNKSNTTDMQIDSRLLTDPDLLWQRNGNNCKTNKNGRLTFGRVNSLGRYERDFELGTTDEKWSLVTGGNKLKNAVRKFVNLPEDNVQEEIAWQVAEMIVKDITSITLGNETEISE